MEKRIFIIGLGRMGSIIGEILSEKGWNVIGYDLSEERRKEAVKSGIRVIESYERIGDYGGRKLFWIMVPHEFVDDVLTTIEPFLEEGDVVIDGGNSYYKESQRRHSELREVGVHFLDVGVSGGVRGRGKGLCLMIGGEEEVFKELEGLFRDLSYEGKGYAYLGRSGAGHFAKMVHNAIEYGMMAAIGEGFELLKESEFNYNLGKVAELFNKGSIVRSFLMELLEEAFGEFGELEGVKGYVEDSGEARWFTEEAVKRGIPASVIVLSLFERFESRRSNSFRDKVVAVLRYEFGRHSLKRD